ncbi:MAG: PKD domain-containing protein [Proteobacteria bacterium]|nr:PKD domain-containing protein [Pseudomonadota bacterium]
MKIKKPGFRISRLMLALGVAMSVPFSAVVGLSDAEALIAATHVYHNHMPNFWPYYDTSKYASTPVGGAIRYTYDGGAMALQSGSVAGYALALKNGKLMPHDNLNQYYDRDAKRNAYTNWPADTARLYNSQHPQSQVQVTMSAAVINDIQDFAERGTFSFFRPGWASKWVDAYNNLKTTNGFHALEPIHFTGHHSMGPLVGPQYFLKDLIYQNVTLQQDYFLGDSFRPSEGFFPTELGFSERLIPTLKKLGVKWSVMGNNHFSRAVKSYPYLDDPGKDTLVSPPNRADLQNDVDGGTWFTLGMEHEQQNIVNYFPFADIPHWVQYVNPETGEVYKLAGIPVDQNGSWLEGWEGKAGPEQTISLFEKDAGGRVPYFVIAHDGDNGEGRAGSQQTWESSGNYTYVQPGVKGMGVQEYLKTYPIPEDDIQHVQDGSWVDTRDSSSDPTWYHWHIPMGVWKGQFAAFTTATGKTFDWPTNFDGTPLGHAVSMEYGYHYLERNFALLQAALNYAETAEQIWLDGHPNYWSPKTDKEKRVTYEGNQLNPYMMSYPVKGDESNDYKGGANPAELGWYFLISSIDSGFGYYDENVDDNVKPSLGFNQSLFFTQPYVEANLSEDRTGPSMWWVQRYPYNPGSANASKAEGWTKLYADNRWVVYTYAYDVSGIQDVKVFIRKHKDKRMSPTDIAPRVYDPSSVCSGVANCDADQVGEWVEYPTKKRDLTPDMNGVAWQDNDVSYNYKVIPGKKIGDTYYAYIDDIQDELVDYYMEATDTKGNVTKSEIQQVYVGAGRYTKKDGKWVEDVNGEQEGTHAFFTDNGARPSYKNITLWAKPSDGSKPASEYRAVGEESWSGASYKTVAQGWYKANIRYIDTSNCADTRYHAYGESASTDGQCLSADESKDWTWHEDEQKFLPGKPDILQPATIYFKPAASVGSVCMHYRALPQNGDEGWTAVPGEKMESSSEKGSGWYQLSHDYEPDATGIEFLFNDCGNSWYKSASGGNFVVNEIADYEVDGTKLTRHEPVNKNKSPVAKASASESSVDAGASVTLSAAGSNDPDGSISSYVWTAGGKKVGTGETVKVNPEKTTTYTLTVTDNDGASATATVKVSVKAVNHAPAASFSAAAKKLTVQFTNTSKDQDGDKLTYSWDFGDGETSAEASPKHVYAEEGDYEVTLTAADPKGLTATAKQTVTVANTNTAPEAAFSVSKSSLKATFNNQSKDADGDKLTYAWDFGDGETSDAVNPTHTYAEEGTYSVYLTVSDGKAESTAQQEVTVQTTHCSPKHSAMYFASTNNKWTFDQMAYNDDDCAWEIAVDFSGKGDENGDQRFKVTTAADWQHGIYGQGLDNGLCDNTRTCGDVFTDVSGTYTVRVFDDMTYDVVPGGQRVLAKCDKHDALYYAGTTNKWTFEKMSCYDGYWTLDVSFTGKGDENGDQRWKVTTSGDWEHGIFGQGLDNGLCDNTRTCGDVFTDVKGTYTLKVKDSDMTWELEEK